MVLSRCELETEGAIWLKPPYSWDRCAVSTDISRIQACGTPFWAAVHGER